MRKTIRVSIPKPCHENWNSMSPKDKGRHCNVCEKTVFDFTNKTDEYIVKTFEQNHNICARLKNIQLDRELAYSRKDRNDYLSHAASSLLVFLTMGLHIGFAQDNPKPVIETVTIPNLIKEKVVSTLHIKGKTDF